MATHSAISEQYGLHRVLVPRGKGTLPQSAVKLDNTPELLSPYEVKISNLDQIQRFDCLREILVCSPPGV